MDYLYSVTSGVDGSFVYVSILYVPSSFLSACVYVAKLCLESTRVCLFAVASGTFLNCALPDLLLPTLHSHGRLDDQTDEVYTFDVDFQLLAFDSGYKFMWCMQLGTCTIQGTRRFQRLRLFPHFSAVDCITAHLTLL